MMKMKTLAALTLLVSPLFTVQMVQAQLPQISIDTTLKLTSGQAVVQ